MLKTKRLSILIALTLALVLTITGCTSTTSGGDNESKDSDKIKVAFIPQIVGIPYFTAMEEGAKKAAEEFGVEFIYSGPVEVSAAEQSKIMDSLIRQEVDAIAVSVLDSSSINPMIKKAKEAGLHPFTTDSDSPDSEREVYVAQALDKDLGYTLIDRLAEQLGGKGDIGIVSGDPTATNLNTWIKYMQERIEEKYPELNILDIRYATTSEQSLKQAQELMIKYPDIDGLIAVASINIPGVAQAVEQAGKAGEIAVIGYGSPNTV
ncbi:MAG: substrate-binding domain-containing protein, partial [Tissierellia bacterium]|nr:substrate-binding domain-containing protein [Tissierellia bacterium]